jgi:hypothetical protein
MTDEERQLLREKLTNTLMVETYMQNDTKNLNQVAQAERLEPFTTVMELAARYGKIAALEALTNLAEFNSEDPDFSDDEREADAQLRLDLGMALEQYALFFGDPEAEAQINHGAVAV